MKWVSMNEVRLGISETYQDEGISIPRALSKWYLSPKYEEEGINMVWE